MQERLREVGIRAARQLYSSDVDEVLAWPKQWGKWPVIVKPSMSGGTDAVYWCHCADDVREAFAAECGKLNVNGVLNETLLVHEYFDGLECVVDTVSFEGDARFGHLPGRAHDGARIAGTVFQGHRSSEKHGGR